MKSAYDDYVGNTKGELDIRTLKSTTSVLLKPNGTVHCITHDNKLENLTAYADVMADMYIFEHLGKTLYDKQVGMVLPK